MLDIGLATELIQDQLKANEPIPDCVALLGFDQSATSLVATWNANRARAEILMSRGRTANMLYLKELSIWRFAHGGFDRLFTDPGSKLVHDFDMGTLVQAGLGQLVEAHQAYQIAPSGHVFKHPSGKRTKRFFLASELIKDEIDAFFVALCTCHVIWPRLLTTHRLFIDTMGIYPIARAMEEICSRESPSPDGRQWEIVSFHSHTGLNDVHLSSSVDPTILISASTSGSMAAALLAKGIPDNAIITILDVTSKERVGTIVHPHDAYLVERYGSTGVVDRISEEETAIELTGEYFAATGKKPRPLTLTIEHAPKGLKQVLSSFTEKGLCRLNGTRGHGTAKVDIISIDEAVIVADKNFQKWVYEELSAKTPMTVSHIVPVSGSAAETFASICAAQLNPYRSRPLVVVRHSDIQTLDSNASGVLVCAPLVGNGHELRVVSRDLRELVPNASRHFLLGVGLPETEESWIRLKQFLAQSGVPTRPYLVSSWQHLPLGALSGSEGAWKRSATLMTQTEHIDADSSIGWDVAIIQESVRLAGDALESAAKSFLTTTSGDSLKLTKGFVYWQADEETLAKADVTSGSYLAMTSALQTAREFDVPIKRLRSSLHEAVVLDPENFLRFNDSVLQASLLRAAYSSELDYASTPQLSLVMREFLVKVFLNHQRPYGDAALEFGFALACEHIRLSSQDIKEIVKCIAPLANIPSPLLGFVYLAWARSGRVAGVQDK